MSLVLTATFAVGCGNSAEDSLTEESDAVTSTSGTRGQAPARGVTREQAAALRSGFPMGIVESFEYFPDANALSDRVDATVAGTFSGYELNPESGDPNIYVPGYAGSSGVLRVYFELQRTLGGAAAEIAEAPERPGEGLIAVDLEYFIPSNYQAEHFAQLDALEGVRFLLFLVDGTIDLESTGAYQLWQDPFAAFAEGVDGTTVRVLHDQRLVGRESIERGAKLHPEASVPLEELGLPDEPPLPDILTRLEHRPFDEVLDELHDGEQSLRV